MINDYLDERYPHPPLDAGRSGIPRTVETGPLPGCYNATGIPWPKTIESSTTGKNCRAGRQSSSKRGIIAANELFKVADYVLSDELSLVDCTLGPLMWRLCALRRGKLGKPGASVEAYAHRIFSRPSFKTSLTQAERDLLLGAS